MVPAHLEFLHTIKASHLSLSIERSAGVPMGRWRQTTRNKDGAASWHDRCAITGIMAGLSLG
jgi:hypothetical protein